MFQATVQSSPVLSDILFISFMFSFNSKSFVFFSHIFLCVLVVLLPLLIHASAPFDRISSSLGASALPLMNQTNNGSQQETNTETISASSTLMNAAWFLVIITVLPVLYCCCVTWAVWNVVSGTDQAGGGGIFQPSNSWGQQGMSGQQNAGGWGGQGGMNKQSPGCIIG
jgi:hypothetical protein